MVYDMEGDWVLDADIRGFFDAIDHDWLRPVRLTQGRSPVRETRTPGSVRGGGGNSGFLPRPNQCFFKLTLKTKSYI